MGYEPNALPLRQIAICYSTIFITHGDSPRHSSTFFFLTLRLLYVPAVISRPLRFMPLRVIWSVPSHGHDTHPSFAMGLCRRSQVPLSLIPCQPIHLAPGRRVIAPMRGLTHTYASICDVCTMCVCQRGPMQADDMNHHGMRISGCAKGINQMWMNKPWHGMWPSRDEAVAAKITK